MESIDIALDITSANKKFSENLYQELGLKSLNSAENFTNFLN